MLGDVDIELLMLIIGAQNLLESAATPTVGWLRFRVRVRVRANPNPFGIRPYLGTWYNTLLLYLTRCFDNVARFK